MEAFHNYNVVERYEGNPILTGGSFPDGYCILHVFSSGIVKYDGRYIMVCRCEDAGLKAYFWIAESEDGLHFVPRPAPMSMPEDDPMFRKYAEINVYDPRVTRIGDTYYLSCSGYYATSRDLYGPYEFQGLVGEGWQLDTIFGHGDFFEWKGDWYHVWCRYRDRSIDRIRDCFIAPVTFGADGSMRDDLCALNGSE